MGPRYFRELEGATSAEEPGTLVLLATISRFTEGARRAVMGSERPMGGVLVQGYQEGGEVAQFIWNAAAGRLLGDALGVRKVFNSGETDDDEGVRTRVLLTWEGRPIKMKKDIPG